MPDCFIVLQPIQFWKRLRGHERPQQSTLRDDPYEGDVSGTEPVNLFKARWMGKEDVSNFVFAVFLTFPVQKDLLLFGDLSCEHTDNGSCQAIPEK